MDPTENIEMSVVLRVVGGRPFVDRCLDRLVPLIGDDPIEILVPFDDQVADVGELVESFPQVRFLEMGSVVTTSSSGSAERDHERYDRRSAHALAHARGRIVAQIEDYALPADDWARQVLEAHELPHAAIGGSVAFGGTQDLAWSVFLLDLGRNPPWRPEGPARYITDVNISYKRGALEAVRDVWADRYNEVLVHWRLLEAGSSLWFRPQIRVLHDRGPLRFGTVFQQRIGWGKVFGLARASRMTAVKRLAYIVTFPAIAMVLVARAGGQVRRSGKEFGRFLWNLPTLFALSLAWTLGEAIGYWIGSQPVVPAALGHGTDGAKGSLVASSSASDRPR